MGEFAAATALQPLGTDAFTWQVPDSWQQGRGAWGGLVSGVTARAALLVESDPTRTLRTVSVHMSGPVLVGPARVAVSPVRIGSAMSTWAVTIHDSTDEQCVHAIVITGSARAVEPAAPFTSWSQIQAPSLPQWSSVPVATVAPPAGPPFGAHLEFRVVDGIPASQSAAHCSGWVRFPDQGTWDAPSLIGIVDAWWPTAFVALAEPRPMATVAFAAHLHVDPQSLPAGEPLAFDSHLTAASEGFTTEIRRLWSPDGRLVVENHQSIVIIR